VFQQQKFGKFYTTQNYYIDGVKVVRPFSEEARLLKIGEEAYLKQCAFIVRLFSMSSIAALLIC
jgi:hypothetical protein